MCHVLIIEDEPLIAMPSRSGTNNAIPNPSSDRIVTPSK